MPANDTSILSEKIFLFIRSGGAYIEVPNLDEFDPSDLQWEETETSNRRSNRRKNWKKTVAEFPEFPATVNYNPAEAGHAAMDAALLSPDPAEFYIEYAEFDTPVFTEFEANVKGAPPATPKNSVHRKSYQIHVTGDQTSSAVRPT